jgi:hypothetical protein
MPLLTIKFWVLPVERELREEKVDVLGDERAITYECVRI